MRKQTGSRNRGWLPAIVNRLSVAAGVALAAGMMAAFAPRAEAAWTKATSTGSTVTNYSTGTTNWTAHIFKTTVGTKTFTVTSAGNVEYLIVAGGGSAGGDCGGGGGAGGVLTGSDYFLAADVYTITVGAGGNNSTAFGQTALAGGNGGTWGGPAIGTSGGSGGGAGGWSTAPGVFGAGTPGPPRQGYDGANGVGNTGGGGGGAGGNGYSG